MVLSEDIRNKLEKNGIERADLEGQLLNSMKSINNELDHHEKLQFMVVVKNPWAIENGFLTPTMKVKRGKVEEAYGPNEDSWYQKREMLVWEGR